jgi:hypothetical protein
VRSVRLDDGDAGAQALDLGEVVAAEHQRAPLGGELGHRVAHRARRLRVEARGGLVEEDDLRLVHQRPHDGQLLPHALAEAADGLVFAASEAEALEVTERARPRRGLVDLVEPHEEAQVLAGGEALVEAGLLREEPHPLPQPRPVVAPQGQPAHGAPPRRRRQEPRQHAHRRRLAGAVGAEQPEDLTRPHLE